AVALSVVATLALSAPLVASAGSTGSTTSKPTVSLRTYHKELVAYRESLQTIRLSFRASVSTAHSTYLGALSVATTYAQRSAAQQAEVTAIIEAASARSAALTALGSPPVKP
ncbi:MAG: hypothetical protein WBD82_00630, partial [Acidimicrobiales bacterium]